MKAVSVISGAGMRCRTCGALTAIKIQHQGLAHCATHCPPWLVKQAERAIRRCRIFSYSDCVLVAVSGGKDGLALCE